MLQDFIIHVYSFFFFFLISWIVILSLLCVCISTYKWWFYPVFEALVICFQFSFGCWVVFEDSMSENLGN